MLASGLSDTDIESIERATLDVVVPDGLRDLPGWLVPTFDGTVGRAKSAVPLSHEPPDLAMVGPILDLYTSQGLAPAFRLPDIGSFADMRAALISCGFARHQPTLTMTGCVSDLLALRSDNSVDVASAPDAAWLNMFLGLGLDAVDGASRTRALARGGETRYVSLRENGQTLACGAAGYGHGWLSVHGMRTAFDQRGRGLARSVLAAMAQEARARGIERVFLQVDASNAPALALYRRAGFALAWPYAYWHPTTPFH